MVTQTQFYNNVLSVRASALPPPAPPKVASILLVSSTLNHRASRSDSIRSKVVIMASSPRFQTSNHLRHVESMKILPSGAGKISHLNAVILGEALASEENDLVFPSDRFSSQALVPTPEKVATTANSFFRSFSPFLI